MPFKSLFVCCVLSFALAPSSFARTDDDAAVGLPSPPARSERLDIYGAGMCHTCEWRPHDKSMAAADQCGKGADGLPNVGVFECGRDPACEPVCNFVRCAQP